MGIYLNPGNQGFQESVNSKIYVDKTGMISYTNSCLQTEQKFICVSRPRRFGKSMALKMLAAYYGKGCDSGKLFAPYAVAGNPDFEKYLNKYNVIVLNIAQFVGWTEGGMIEYLEESVLEDLREEYGSVLPDKKIPLSVAFQKIYAKFGTPFVFLIDEWDCPMRERRTDEALQKQYLDFLRNLLKDQSYVALAYMTGILPIKKYGSHSALNMFGEFSMTEPFGLEEYVGFTETEAAALCDAFGMDAEEVARWYDGYSFTHCKHVYNPKSVVETMLHHKLANYWTRTETYEALKMYIDMDFEHLREAVVTMLGGGRVVVNTGSFSNDMNNFRTRDDVLTLLIHLGYLGFDSEKKEVFIPNKEISEEFENAMSVSGWQEVMRVLEDSERLMEDTLAGREAEVANALDKVHGEVSSILTYNDENTLSCVISLAYYAAKKDYVICRELPAGKGFADVVFVPRKNVCKPALVVELKYDCSVEAAIAQIKERRYLDCLKDYEGEVLLVGINYGKKTKRHECRIERMALENRA